MPVSHNRAGTGKGAIERGIHQQKSVYRVAPGSSGTTTAVSSGLDENATPAASLAAPLRPGAISFNFAMSTPPKTRLQPAFAHIKYAARIISSNRLTRRLLTVMAVMLLVITILAARSAYYSPRLWNVTEIPIAFWSWQTDTPSDSDVQQAIRETSARSLFLRAGQIDYERLEPKRIRAVRGEMPRHIELHLVYNATRGLLFAFENIAPRELASVIAAAFAEDCARAERDGARVVGLQLDIDSPTRLLKHYASVIRALRQKLPQGVKLSVTGLPTWMESRSLKDLLSQTDFWTPQFYGAQIPEKLDQWIPISTPESVLRFTKRARRLGHAFYAGLAAYGYAILYSKDGSLVAIRGDLDPARIANDKNLTLIQHGPFAYDKPPEPLASEWRYLYRAERDTVISGLMVRKGESLILDLPSTHSLRATARAVRKEAGQSLLGLCIFRLPSPKDPTNLTIKEVADALADRDGVFSFEARAVKQISSDSNNNFHKVILSMTNSGSICPRQAECAMTAALSVPDGSVREVRLDGFHEFYPLFARWKSSRGYSSTIRRANTLRLVSRWLRPGANASAIIEFDKPPPDELPLRVIITTADFKEIEIEEKIVMVESENENEQQTKK